MGNRDQLLRGLQTLGLHKMPGNSATLLQMQVDALFKFIGKDAARGSLNLDEFKTALELPESTVESTLAMPMASCRGFMSAIVPLSSVSGLPVRGRATDGLPTRSAMPPVSEVMAPVRLVPLTAPMIKRLGSGRF